MPAASQRSSSAGPTPHTCARVNGAQRNAERSAHFRQRQARFVIRFETRQQACADDERNRCDDVRVAPAWLVPFLSVSRASEHRQATPTSTHRNDFGDEQRDLVARLELRQRRKLRQRIDRLAEPAHGAAARWVTTLRRRTPREALPDGVVIGVRTLLLAAHASV